MRIGLTYDLKSYYLAKGFSQEQVAELDCEETINSIASALEKHGHDVERIGCLEQLMQALLQGKRWDLVFNIAEGLYGIAREAQIPGLLDAYQIPHPFSNTEVLAVALDKSLTNAVMKSYQVPVADFRVVRQEMDIAKVDLPFPLFVKPVAEGTSKGITARSVIHNQQELAVRCRELLEEFHQPVLVETYLPGREFTVGMLGSGEEARVLGVMEVCLHGAADSQGYTFENKQKYEDRVSYHLVDEPDVAQLALKAWSALNCLDAGRVDVRMNAAGNPVFLEVNPLAGLNPNYSDLCILCKLIDFPYDQLIHSIVQSCLKRHGLDSAILTNAACLCTLVQTDVSVA
ncbi:MAG: ATP-grasp domain-containing protein [Lentisphaeria bacterium]|nr:ATP-grasp domain-containing protein [Lentisphaeria bacterium]